MPWTASQPGPVDDGQILRGHLAQATVAHDDSTVDDILIAFLHIQVDADSQSIAYGKMEQCLVGAVLTDLVRPQGSVKEPGFAREEILQEEWPYGGVAVIGDSDSDSINGHVPYPQAVFTKTEMGPHGSCGFPGSK